MITREIIRELAEFQSPQGDAITFYYQPGTPPDKSHRQEIIQIKDLVKDAIHRAERAGKNGNVKGDLQRILELSDTLHGNSGRAKGIFACASQGYWREVDLPSRIGNTRIVMNSRFHVSPLAGLGESLQKTCVCLVDRTIARMFELQMTTITERDSFSSELPRRGRSDGFGGFDAGHAERKVENEAMNHFKRVGEVLLEKYGTGSCENLVIGCRDDAWPMIEKVLHPYLKQRLVGQFVIDPAVASADEVRQRAQSLLNDHAEREHQRLLDEILNEARANNYGALGLRRTLRALEQGEVQTLLIGEGFAAEGVECTNCGHLDMRMVANCAACGQQTRDVDDIADAIVERALRFGVNVIRIPANPELQKAGDIGALLRFRAERSVGGRLA